MDSDRQHDASHDPSLTPYALVLGALLALTALTVLAATVHFGHPWSDLIALLIALSKAGLVITFFMHVRGSSPMVKLSLASGAVGVLVFFLLILSDYLTRFLG